LLLIPHTCQCVFRVHYRPDTSLSTGLRRSMAVKHVGCLVYTHTAKDLLILQSAESASFTFCAFCCACVKAS